MRELNRSDYLLKIIVEEFIKKAEPVGSKVLISEYNLSWSSATVRAEMSNLEDLGFLEKPHTSSGRVPSSMGYRYYIENLREESLDIDLKNQIATLFDTRSTNLNEVIKHSCQWLSDITNLTTVVLGPNADKEYLSKIQVIPLSESAEIVILVTNTGYVEHRNFVIPNGLAIKDFEMTVDILSERLVGTAISDLIEKTKALEPILAQRVREHELVFKAFIDAFKKFSNERMAVYGKDNLLEQKEFTADISNLKKLVSLLETDELWTQLSNRDNLVVKIGNETYLQEYENASIISSKIDIGGIEQGTIALVGPKRMDYNKAIEAMKFIQQKIKELKKNE
jgi:heat-inducible transcriptional repressor